MKPSFVRLFKTVTTLCLSLIPNAVCAQPAARPLPVAAIARLHFGADAPWYEANIPFLEIDDPEIQRIYYYRWKLYRSHLRDIGAQGSDVTEFLGDVPWARHPYTDLNDSSAFHIMEGRWLRNPAFVAALVDHLYDGGGNDRHFTEWIAAATLAWSQVTGDPGPALRHLDAMQHIYNLWDDHFDAERNLYWIEPLLDATEYTIASIDASGAGFTETPSTHDSENGFTGGFAFRPTINAYQFGNARAIAQLARIGGKPDLAAEYTRRAEALRQATMAQLWNPQLQHFTDVYQRSTPFVHAGEFIRGREAAGYLPWMFEMPPRRANRPDYSVAWRHLLNTGELEGPGGVRTVEPTYPRYLRQYRHDRATGGAECQWNGPSWPFQTSEALTALANLLHDDSQIVIGRADYLHLLRQYTQQHLLSPHEADLQEDYDPDLGKAIVGLPRSHHYNHSTYNDLILSGLVGIRPREDDVLDIDPLLPPPGSPERAIRFFAVQGIRYHGHDLTVLWDADGTHYRAGAGLSVFSDGRRLAGPAPLQRLLLPLKPRQTRSQPLPVDAAINVWVRAPARFELDLPIASASSTAEGSNPYEAIDGRLWFFPEIANGWSPLPSDQDAWLAVDLRETKRIDAAEIDFFADPSVYRVPTAFRLQRLSGGHWLDLPGQLKTPLHPVANGVNRVAFPPVEAQNFRILLPGPGSRTRLVELKLFAGAGAKSRVPEAR